jgi:alcohol dehydrogenase class IV
MTDTSQARSRDPLRLARYALPTTIVYGTGALEQLPALLVEAGIEHPLIVTDRGLARTPIPGRARAVLVNAGVRHGLFADVEPDPTLELVDRIATHLRDGGHDGVIGLGGGSAMDAAKAAAAAAAAGTPVREIVGPDKVTVEPLPTIAIPTTAGTGSEVTRFAVLSDPEAGVKASVSSMRIMPRFAILDPSLTAGLPAALTASTGLDALAHAVESFGSVWNNPVSEGMALHAVALVGEHLRTAVSEPNDLVARAGMLAASCMAELAANSTRLGLAHALAVPLGGTNHVPHGVGVAMMLAPMCAYNEVVDPARYARLSVVFGETGTLFSTLIARLSADLGLHARLRDFGFSDADRERVVEIALRSDNVLANPRPVEAADLRALLEQAR